MSPTKNLTEEALWTLTKEGAKLTTTFAGQTTELTELPLPLPQEIQSKRLLQVPGVYDLDSTVLANLNEELGYQSELNTFDAPTVKVKVIFEELLLTANGKEVSSGSNPIIGTVGGEGCPEEEKTMPVSFTGEIVSGTIADSIELGGVVTATAENTATVSSTIGLEKGTYTLTGVATITSDKGDIVVVPAQGSFEIKEAACPTGPPVGPANSHGEPHLRTYDSSSSRST